MKPDEGQMTEIWEGLRERYPLLERMVVHSFGEEKRGSLSAFLRLVSRGVR